MTQDIANDLDQAQEIAARALARARELGFDQLAVRTSRVRQYGIRLAQSTICRENVARDLLGFEAVANWQGREAAFACQIVGENELVERLKLLRREIEAQPEDKEHVLPTPPTGNLTWDLAAGDFETLYGPATIYPLIERYVSRLRSCGLRVTGYLEPQEIEAREHRSNGLVLRTRDHGITISVTVDDQETGAIGTSVRASTHAERDELDRLIGEAVAEATEICARSAKPRALDPGDYTVILSPQAVLDTIGTLFVYGMTDRRKIDEGRTFLSRMREELRFPEGLRLAQTLSLPVKEKTYADLPLNHRLSPCQSLTLIDHGRITDLHCGAFWAKRLGVPETFAADKAPPLLLDARPGSALSGRHKTIQDLIKDTPRGIYICNTWYLRMVAEMDGVITGMTRDGLFEIKDGQIAGPLLNMRWHDSPFRILQSVTGLSEQRHVLGRSRLSGRGRTALASVPALRIENFHFSSVTKF